MNTHVAARELILLLLTFIAPDCSVVVSKKTGSVEVVGRDWETRITDMLPIHFHGVDGVFEGIPGVSLKGRQQRGTTIHGIPLHREADVDTRSGQIILARIFVPTKSVITVRRTIVIKMTDVV